MEVKEFIETLRKLNFSLVVQNERLVLKGSKKKLSDEEIVNIKANDFVINYIKENKDKLIEYISFNAKNHSSGEEIKSVLSTYHLSGLQQGMLFHGLYNEKTKAYIDQLSFEITGIEIDFFKKSWECVLAKHTILRTAFYSENFNQPVQSVYNRAELPIEVLDYRQMSVTEQNEAIRLYEENDRKKAFDFKIPPLMRIALIRLTEKSWQMVWTSHHILFDGWSRQLLMKEFLSFYELVFAGIEADIGEEDRFQDYIRYIDRSNKKQEETYWRNYMRGVEQSTLLPFIETTTELNKGVGSYKSTSLKIDAVVKSQIESYVQQCRITVNTLMQGVWSYLLHCYTGSKNIVYGVVVSGRPDDLLHVEQRVGLYINTLPLHSVLPEDQSIAAWLQNLQSEQVSSRQYQHTPLKDIQELTTIQGDLFDTLLVFQNYPVSQVLSSRHWKLQIQNVQVYEQTNFPLTVTIGTSAQISINFSYNTSLLSEVYVKEIGDHFEYVLVQMVSKPEGRLNDIRLLTPQAEQQLLVEFNDTKADYPKDKTIVDLFEEQSASTPQATAVVFNQERLTYKELNERSNRLAHYLKGKGIREEMLVAICIERSIEMIIGILGILKAGGAYVPLDPEYPAERISYMLEDSGAAVAVSSRASRSKLQSRDGIDIIELDGDWQEINRQPVHNPQSGVKPDHLVYVIYTSGSTGKPKGVMIEHSSLINLLLSISDKVDFNFDSSFLSVTTFSFDICYLEFYMPLISGGKLIVVSREVATDGFKLAESLSYYRPTHMQGTPSTWQLLLNSGWENKDAIKILIGGEAVQEDIKNQLTRIGDVFNLYGPTETTIWSSIKKLATDQKVLIGKPIANTSIYIVNERYQLCPPKVIGSIYIGGVGLGRGYLNRELLTAERFIANPWGGGEGSRLYRTGDMGRWLSDGEIEYLGRVDEQVKIRGYRIELGEIESELRWGGIVSQGVVVVREDSSGERRLVAYYVAGEDVLRLKERELYMSRVGTWKDLYELEYSDPEEEIDEEFNIGIWQDSFSGGKLGRGEMREWLGDIVGVILSEGAGHVVEIGMGSGLIYYQLAGKVRKYTGTDFSGATIGRILRRVSMGLRDYGPTDLRVSAAHEVALGEDEEVNTVVINSVIQYFPGEAYMDEVIKRSMLLLKGEGRIIIGDVRDLRLLELFKGRLELLKLQHSVGLGEFRWLVEQEVLREEELCFSPWYFYGLRLVYPQITHIDIQWKGGSCINELTLYRYTVVIYVGIEREVIKPLWQSWDVADRQGIIKGLQQGMAMAALKDVPNPRLWKEKLLNRALQDRTVSTAGELLGIIEKEDKESKEAGAFLDLARSKGYYCRLLLDEDPLKVNVVIEKDRTGSFIQSVYSEKEYVGKGSFTNIPLFTDISLVLQKDIRAMLQQRLPEYMIPGEFIAVRRLPLTDNGKVDRLFLSRREDRGKANKLSYAPGRNETEQKLVDIWQELLGIDRIGIHDNFFELGGHSLLAMRLVSAVRRQQGTELAVKDVFAHPSIAELSSHLALQSRGLLLPPVQVQERPERIPLSFSQERLWFIDQLEGSAQYHIRAVLRVKGALNREALTKAFQHIISRHEVLRTVIGEKDGQPYQYIRDQYGWELSVAEGTLYKEDREGLQGYIQQLVSRPFNLSEDYMLRADLIVLGQQEHVLVVTLHHIASDGWSMSIIVRELSELYGSYAAGGQSSLAPLHLQYADYAIWQRRYLRGEVLEKKLGYWKEKLQSAAPLQLPSDYARPAVQSTRGAISGFSVSKAVSAQLQVISRQQGVTLFMTLLSAFKVLLYRYSGQEDISAGTPVANRMHGEAEELVGFFVNTLVIRSQVSGGASFTELLQQVRSATLEAYEHQEVPFEKVVEAAVKQRDMSRSPLFQVMFVLQNTPDIPVLHLGELLLSGQTFAHSSSRYDLTFSLSETAFGLQGSVEYCTDLYKEETIARMTAHFTQLLGSVVKEPHQKVGSLPMLGAAEEREMLRDFNDTGLDYPQDSTLVGLFEEQVLERPLGIALISGGEQLSYKELNERSNQLGHYLRHKGVRQDTLVPVCIERGIELVVAMAGILKSGGAYVPIDPQYPAERIRYMVEDTGAVIAVSVKGTGEKLRFQGVDVIELEDVSIRGYGRENPAPVAGAGGLAYVIYTSGSTGRPKGVMIEHRSVVNLVWWHRKQYEVTAQSRATSVAGAGFDAFGWELWPYLLSGASVNIIDDETRLSPVRIAELIDAAGITHSFLSTVLVREFIQAAASSGGVPGLRYLLTGGDRLSSVNMEGAGYILVNNYGPTEYTVVTSSCRIEGNGEVTAPPIGKPVANTRIYIINEQQQLVPIGVMGEISVGGAGLARGYLNLAGLTSEKFIVNPFGQGDGERMYKTGDIGRWLADGNIEYYGRKDEQVKIRGYRIELGEIESVLLQSELVREAVVLAREDGEGRRRLVGYVVADGLFNKEGISSYLHEKLPDYMVPGVWVRLESLPLTPNGKIDKKALPDVDQEGLVSNEYAAPRNETEEKLATIWQDLLHLNRVGIYDNFFELGGHSLLAMRVVSAIRKELGAEVAVKDVFVHPTIAALSQYLEGQSKGLLPAVTVQPRPQRIPLSFSQERLWFVDQLEGSMQYHSPAVIRLQGVLNREALQYALGSIVKRHEVLRTVFLTQEGRPYQYIREQDGWQLSVINGAEYAHDAKGLQSFTEKIIKEPFDLSKDYMLRADLITLAEQEHILVVTMHHIASDEWSVSIIVKEVVELYSSFEQGREMQLEPLQLQYADYAIWQRNYLHQEVLDERVVGYWKDKLQGVAPLELPADNIRPPVRSTKGASAGFVIDKALSGQLQLLSQQQGATLFMTLLAVYKVLLYRYSGQEDICVGTSIANRPQRELEGLIGFFVNTLALRDEVKGNVSFTDLLQQVRVTTLEAYEHQDVPFEKVVEVALKERDAARSPLFQVMLVLRNTPVAEQLRFGEAILSAERYEQTTSKFDITFFITETAQGLQGLVEYSTELYSEQTINRMTAHFKELLGAVVREPQGQVGLLPMLTKAEAELLAGFSKAQVAYSKDRSIVDLFEEQAAKTPSAAAIVFEKEVLSYRQLNERSNRLAHHLRSLGVRSETLVPLCIERSAEMMVGMLGILKAGGAYVPIDIGFPLERISYMVKDSGASIVVSSKESRLQLGVDAEAEVAVIETDGDWTDMEMGSYNLLSTVKPHHLAYVIYTSGSTGKPKGVMIEHRSLVDYVSGLQQSIQIEQCRSFALVSTIATDLGNTVIYSSLLTGATLHLFSREAVSNIEAIHRYFKEHAIDCLKIVPSHWKALCTKEELLLPSRLLIFGGEALQAPEAEAVSLSGSACRVVNHYGPTETTIGKLLHVVEKDRRYNNTIPVGKPFSNTQVYVLSKELRLCAVGVPGQLYIAGDGVARGYVNNRDLTDEKFIKNPFAQQAGSRMYTTGDLVKYLADGNIVFIGRTDDQVKIRGYRIEPAEIESVLQQCGLVHQAAVLVSEDKQGSKRLAAYIVPQGRYDREGIVAYMKEKLPEYMVPALLVELDSLPLTANGKTDRKALPDPEEAESAARRYEAPRNEGEAALAQIWQEVLEAEQVGIHDDFFELGGHSLLAVRLVSAIRKAFSVEMPISNIFDYPTIALLSAQLEGNPDTPVLPSIEAVHPRPEYIPLSFSQERLWFIDRLEGSVQYHIPAVLRLKGRLNKEALAFALQSIVNRHEVLRTVIGEREGQAYQYIKDKDEWQLAVVDNQVYTEDPQGLHFCIQQLISKPFDLSKDYMLRGDLIILGQQEHILVITLHHIASDGWSTSVMVKEAAELYSAFEQNRPSQLVPLQIQYADYAIWQRRYLEGEVLDKKTGYWKEKLQATAPLQLPSDYGRPAVQSTRGAVKEFSIDTTLSAQLQTLSRQHNTTLFMTLLAAFKVLLYRYSAQQDICVGTPIAGRQQHETENLIGFFVNTLALRTNVKGNDTFTALLQEVKITAMQAYAHQEVPFEKVVETAVKERDTSRSPLFQVMFVLQNTPDIPHLQLGEVELFPVSFEQNSSKFDLTFALLETVNGLQGSLQYCTDLYSEETIERMLGHFKELLASAVKEPHQKIAALQMLTPAERQQLLTEFNNTKALYPADKSIADLFEEQAAKTPHTTAVIFKDQKLSYKQLNQQTNQLAHYLRSKGVKEEILVPVCIERSPEMITAILAVLKTGAAYVPIDPQYPQERIQFILNDTKAYIIVTSKVSKSKFQAIEYLNIIELDEERETISFQPKGNLSINIKPHYLAYVIYTSGSTGMPKGVMVEHKSLINYLLNNKARYISNEKSVSGSFIHLSYTFDASVTAFFMPLLFGKSVVIGSENGVNVFKDSNLSKYAPYDFIKVTPSHLELLNDLFKDDNKNRLTGKLVIGGEALRLSQLNYFIEKGVEIEIFNEYGPTEATVGCTTYRFNTLSENEKLKNEISIGKPINNIELYIMDGDNQLVPVGVPGQICIGGDGLARGYLNRPQLTAEKFIINPFNEKTKERIYKTGDIGRWLKDGNIEFLGRTDDQVKIRGYRIELGEIESVLLQSELVSQAAVLAKNDKEGNKQLVGYIVPNGLFEHDAIAYYIKGILPEFMVPAIWVEMENLPLTINGKIDREALPDPDTSKLLSKEYVAPRNELEVKLAEIWQQLLNIERVGIHDNFFELGGHSLMAMRMVSHIEKNLSLSFPIQLLFQFSTISELSNYLEFQSNKLIEKKNFAGFKTLDI